MTTNDLLLSAWDRGLLVPLLCLAALGAYGVRFRRRLRARGALFVLAVALFFLALASPIGVLARGYLFSAHMLQHLLLMLAVPPLVYLGLPPDDGAARTGAGAHAARGPANRGILGAWLAGVGAMWIWHAPVLCNAAAASAPVQALQTASLVVMGLAFWRPILAPRRSERLAVFPAIGYLFAACAACTVLGVMVTLSPVEVCSAYMHPVDSLGVVPLLREGWGLSPKADQEVGGLMMWVPACLVYAAAILSILGRHYAAEHALADAEGAE